MLRSADADKQIVSIAADGPAHREGTTPSVLRPRYSAHIISSVSQSKINGPEPRKHMVKGMDGGQMTRAWCDECGRRVVVRVGADGSGLWIRSDKMGERIGIKAGMRFGPGLRPLTQRPV